MKAKCQEILDKLNPLDQDAINNGITEREGLVGSMSPEQRGKLAVGVVSDHMENLLRERAGMVAQLGEDKPDDLTMQMKLKQVRLATRRVDIDHFTALKGHEALPMLAEASDEEFTEKVTALSKQWVEEQKAQSPDEFRAFVLDKWAVSPEAISSLRKEAKKAAADLAKEKAKVKLQNTGVDLRRHWELMKAELKAKNEAEGITAMNKIFTATTRADLFAGLVTENATPATRMYVDRVREAVPPFKEWVIEKAGLSDGLRGVEDYRAGPQAKIEEFVRGSAYVQGASEGGSSRYDRFARAYLPTLPAGKRSDTNATTQERIDALRNAADDYLNLVRQVTDLVRGAERAGTTVDKVQRALWKEGKTPKMGEYQGRWSALDEDKATPLGNELREKGILANEDAWKISMWNSSTAKLVVNEPSLKIEDQQRRKPLLPPRLTAIERKGLDDRRTGDVTPQQFKEKFGFADIGFGTWVTSGEDQVHLNNAWDAFADLADHLGIDPKHIGMGGRLHFTLGALGHGSKAAATYHPQHPGPEGSVKVINLTKTKGDGTVAHEWFHALDDFLREDAASKSVIQAIVRALAWRRATFDELRTAAIRGLRKDSWMTGNKRATPIENAAALIDYYAGKSEPTEYKRNADAMDPDYWGNDRELLARAFESWVYDSMKGSNNYLVNPWVADGATTQPTYKGTPFPRGEERKTFGQWFKALVESLTYTEEGEPRVNAKKFYEAAPEKGEDYLRMVEDLKSNLPVLQDQLEREKLMKVAEAEAQKRAKAEAEAAAQREREAVHQPPPAPPAGELDVPDLEAVFDQAAEAARAEAHENVTAPEVGEPALFERTTPPAIPKGPPDVPPQLEAARGEPDKKATQLISEAAKLGVKGVDEALTGLTKLFGAGKIQSFPGGFDEETYKQAKPHFEAALKAFQEAGKTLVDLFKLLIQQFGEGVKPYAIRFAKDMSLTADLGKKPSASKELAVWVKGQLNRPGADHGRPATIITSHQLFERANEFFGGTQAEGKYTPKDAYDAAEAGMNLWILENAGRAFQIDPEQQGARVAIKLLDTITGLLPTQTKRTGEQDEFQQFSTVPALAYMANWVANVQEGEVMGEPSAGVGGLASFARAAGADLILNELSSRRAAVLREVLPGARVFAENAEHIANVLPPDARPTVVVMNPPFSSTAGRIEGHRDSMTGAQHVESALAWLKPGGRLVAIVGKGMAHGEPRFSSWWKKIEAEHNVRAILSLNGQEYAKYGTTYDNVLMVIDKTGPTTGKVITGRVEAYNELPALLEGVRNDRKQPSAADRAPQQPAAQPDGGEAVAPGLGQPGQPARPDVGALGDQRGNLPGAGGARDGAGRAGAGRGDGLRDGGAGRKPGARTGRAGGPEPGGSGEPAAGGDQRPDERVELDGSALEQRNNELTESIFETYAPIKARVKGSKPHPGKLVESAAMAAVEPADVSYTPNLPREAIEKGWISDAQIEAVIYAGQAHSEMLPNGKRRGYFIGDGTGVGKGREIASIILDNLRQGRKKSVWISAAAGLVNDAKRDYGGVVGREADAVNEIFELRNVGAGGASPSGKITRKDGTVFLTYDTLKGGEKAQGDAKAAAQTSLKQLVEWLGADFDGVIAFDESHKMQNLGGGKGPRGKLKPAQRALVAQELRDAMPNARVVYVSATGATEVANLAYADRLGLWGAKTSFTDANDFAAKIGAAGLAAMELVARDMKSMGVYISRSLSYDGVEQTTIDAAFTPLQKEIYDELARAWQIVLKDVNAALKDTKQAKNGQAKSAALSAFWSTQQRFFNQVITSMMTPAAIDRAKAEIANGHTILFQLVNTNEATQERIIEAADANETPLEELDFTPKQTLIEYLRKSFPVVAYEEYKDDNGNVRSRPVLDSKGEPVVDRAMVEKRDALIAKLEKEVRVPDNPIDLIYEGLGEKAVGEVSGRGRRFQKVMARDGSFTLEERKRTGKSNRADAEAFMANKKDALIFTDAGGTGFSFHSDKGVKNQRRRFHIILQPGWVAANAMQGIGRSHRSNEVNQPVVALPRSDIKAQKRFISSIARRLDQLGALTKGQRNTTSQGLFTNRDNLESKYAKAALRSLLEDMAPGQRSIENSAELVAAMGLEGIYEEISGSIAETKMPTIQRFLNRLLSLTTGQQDQLFTEFEMRMDAAIDAAIQNGTYDDGMQTVKALKVHKLRDEVVHVDEKTKTPTRYVELELTQPTLLNEWKRAQDVIALQTGREVSYYQDTVSGKPFAVINLGERMDGKGRVEHRGYRIDVTAPSKTSRGHYIGDRDKFERGGDWRAVKRDESGAVVHAEVEDRHVAAKIYRYKKIGAAEAEYLWGAALEEQPKTFTENMHLLTGALLPVWDRINVDSEKTVAVVRTQTDAGERLIGRVISDEDRAAVLKNLGVGAIRADMPATEIITRIMRGESAQLSNGWVLRRVKVANEPRIEIIASYLSPGEKRILQQQGAILERISYAERMFIPTGDPAVFDALTRGANRPVVDFIAAPQNPAVFSENVNEQKRTPPRERREKGIPLKALTEAVAKTLGRDLPADAFVARPLPDDLAPAVAAIERVWGIRVVPFVNNSPEIIGVNGVHTASDNALYVNVEAEYPLLQIVGHELTHEMRRRAPGLYAELRDRVAPLLKNRSGYAEFRVNKVYRSNAEAVEEEMIADLVGENFRQRGFWRAMAEKDPGLAERIVDWVLDFIDRTLQAIRGAYRAEMHVSDLEAARAAVVDAMAAFAKEPSPEAESKPVMFSATDKIRRHAVNRVNDLVRTSRQFSWWDRTVGTQLHKATKNPWFRRVFDRGQQYLQDVSEFASRSMDEAPNILLKLEKLSDVMKMGAKQEDLAKVAKAIFTETLDRQLSDEATLRSTFGLDDRQIGFYREARRAINRSLTDLAASEYVRKSRNMGLDQAHEAVRANPDEAAETILTAMAERLRILRRREGEYARDPALAGALQNVRDQIAVMDQTRKEIEKAAERVAKLKEQGYAPLMRFGKYSVHVFHETDSGTRATDFFSMYESEREANAAARALKEEFPDSYVEQGIMSQEAWKLFRGVSPDTLEVFADALGVDEAPVFQQYLKLAVNNRSALKRLIKRHGTPGFSWDTSRVLASFITSNARRTSGNWHFADMLKDVAAIPRSEGDVKDEAVRLVEYLQNPQEEAAGLRGFLFAQFLGGSVAAAMVNLTQPLLMTFPYLQRFGATPAMMLRAARTATGAPPRGTALAAAMDKAAQDGVIAPNEIHQLYAESIRSFGSNIWIRRAMRVWGSLFAVSEAFNRRLTFAAAFEAATTKGLEQPYEFAVRAVQETQGIYNRGNRPNWARGAVGATIFTFKQFSIAYLEFLARLPKEQRVLALALLVLAAGLQGLPFADDLDDLLDTLGQSLGYNTNAKRWKRRLLEDAFGPTAGGFVLQGFSSLPGMPLDVQGRLGLGNLIPGTAVFKRSEVDKSRDVLEVLGPAGSLAQSAVKAAGKAQRGDFGGVGGAFGQFAPLAIQNALKGAEMAQMGIYRDSHGRRVVDVDRYDAAVKAIGFQPRDVAQESRRAQEVRQLVAMAKVVEADIADTWAQGIFEKNPQKIESARRELIEWNLKNPESRILVVPAQIQRRVQEMMKTREQRTLKAAPRELRGTVKQDMQR